MNVDFVRFNATDDVELQGWLSNHPGDTAVLHIHGMSGNGYENYFLDNLRAVYSKLSLSFFTIDTRGRGVMSDFRQGNSAKRAGSCFEIFEECIHDIAGALTYLASLGKTKIILQGHSLGCTKVVHYLSTTSPTSIKAVILLAPTDMVGWSKTDPHNKIYMQRSSKLLAEGKGDHLVNPECWPDKTPISAQTYPTICAAGSSADIYGERVGGALLGRIELPMLIPYGDSDVGIQNIDGSMENWIKRVTPIKNKNTEIVVIKGAGHGFRGYEKELTDVIEKFVMQTSM